MPLTEVIESFDNAVQACEHDEHHFRLAKIRRCYLCMLERLIIQTPTANTCFDLIYLEKYSDTDEHLQKLLRSCHFNNAPDSVALVQVMWDTLTCRPNSDRHSMSCSVMAQLCAKALTRLTKFLPTSDSTELMNTMLMYLPAVPERCRNEVISAVVESIRARPHLSHRVQYEALLLSESSPSGCPALLMLTSQVVKFARHTPRRQLKHHAENCVNILLSSPKEQRELRLLASVGLEVLAESHPSALDYVENRKLYTVLVERLASFEPAVVRSLCSTFTSRNIVVATLRAKCLDKIFADCLLTCQSGQTAASVLDSLTESGKNIVELMCQNANTIFPSLVALLDTRSPEREIVRKAFKLMTNIFSEPRSCQLDELLVARLVRHCARSYDDDRDTQLAARRCFVSFLIGGHLTTNSDFALANLALSKCFAANLRDEVSVAALSLALLTFVETLSASLSLLGPKHEHSACFLAMLQVYLPCIAAKIREQQLDNSVTLAPQLFKLAVIAVEHLEKNNDIEAASAVESTVRCLGPLLKCRRDDPSAQRLLTYYVYLVGKHEDKEDFEVIRRGFEQQRQQQWQPNDSNQAEFNPEAFYAQMFLCHLDESSSVDVQSLLKQNLERIFSVSRLWSVALRRNLFDNVFRFAFAGMQAADQIELQRVFLRFPSSAIDTAYLARHPHLIDSLMSSTKLRLHARKVLIRACEDRNAAVVRYVLTSHSWPEWKEFVVKCIVSCSDADGPNELLREMLSAENEDVAVVVLESLVSMVCTLLANGSSAFVSRALEVFLIILRTPLDSRGVFKRVVGPGVEALIQRLCAHIEKIDDLRVPLALLAAVLKSRSASDRRRLVADIANRTACLTKAMSVDLAGSLEMLLFLAKASPTRALLVPSPQLRKLAVSSDVKSATRRAALSVLSRAVDPNVSAIALDRHFTTDELLSITDDTLLNPLFEKEALELWLAIPKDSPDVALLTILKERIRMALVSDYVYSPQITLTLLNCFRQSGACSEATRMLLPYIKLWWEHMAKNTWRKTHDD